MNWIGGNLSRHRRRKDRKEDMANQERYFARARSRQREKAKANPVDLSAANFIPNYSAVSNAAARVTRPNSPSWLPVPLGSPKISKSLADLGNASEIMQHDAAKRPSCLVPPSQTSGSAVFNSQSTKDHFIGTAGQRRSLLKEDDFMRNKLPKHLTVKPAQEGIPTSHREIRPSDGGQRGRRKRRRSQVTSPPVDTTIRIRVGSKSYQWSEAENSTREPAYNSSSSSSSADEPRCIASSTGDASYVIGESFTGPSSLAISPSPWLSPGNRRPAHCRAPSDSTKHNPMTAYTDALSPKSTASSTTSSMAVEIGSGQRSPKFGMDEEHVWRAWLSPDMPEFQVLKKPQDMSADMARHLSAPMPQGSGNWYAAHPGRPRKRPPRT